MRETPCAHGQLRCCNVRGGGGMIKIEIRSRNNRKQRTSPRPLTLAFRCGSNPTPVGSPGASLYHDGQQSQPLPLQSGRLPNMVSVISTKVVLF